MAHIFQRCPKPENTYRHIVEILPLLLVQHTKLTSTMCNTDPLGFERRSPCTGVPTEGTLFSQELIVSNYVKGTYRKEHSNPRCHYFNDNEDFGK